VRQALGYGQTLCRRFSSWCIELARRAHFHRALGCTSCLLVPFSTNFVCFVLFVQVWTMFNSVSVYLCSSYLHSHLYDLAIRIPVRHVLLGSASVAAKDGRPYTKHNNPSSTTITFTNPTHPLASFQNGPGCTLLQHPTSPALLTSPTPRQSELVCGACIGTAQIGASLVALLGFIFKRSSLRSFRDMIITSLIYTLLFTTSRWKV